MTKQYFVYILASRKDGVLYVGITNDIVKRIYQHKNSLVESFTKKYHIHKLVHFEMYDDSINAIAREKQLKKWKREWKIKLIEKNNLEWKDLYNEIL